MAKKLVIYGKNDFTQNVYYYFKTYSDYEITGFTIDRAFKDAEEIDGLPLVEFEKVTEVFPPENHEMFVALGYRNMNKIRGQKIQEAKIKGYKLAKFIHPSCYVENSATVGDNCFLFERVTLSQGTKIGEGTVIQCGGVVCHHSETGENCFICANSTINGYVKIEDNCFIGAGAVVRDNLTVKKETLVGAGVTLLEDTKEKEIYKSPSPILLGITSDKLKQI